MVTTSTTGRTTPPEPLRVVFFGTPEFAVPTLDALLRSRHVVVGVVTQPSRPRGRGHKILDPPVKTIAAAAGVPILQPLRLKDTAFLEELAGVASRSWRRRRVRKDSD